MCEHLPLRAYRLSIRHFYGKRDFHLDTEITGEWPGLVSRVRGHWIGL